MAVFYHWVPEDDELLYLGHTIKSRIRWLLNQQDRDDPRAIAAALAHARRLRDKPRPTVDHADRAWRHYDRVIAVLSDEVIVNA